MAGYVDLHCHWVWEIDDGARTEAEGLAILRGLSDVGFSHVVATPHMRPGLFDNAPGDIEAAYLRARSQLTSQPGLPSVSLGAEHHFDPDVITRIEQGEALPYGSGGAEPGPAVLIEFEDLSPLYVLDRAIHRLTQRGILPVIAHPERYRAIWSDLWPLQHLLDIGCAALLDSCALVGKYGTAPKRTALALLEEGAYHAACSDAHRPSDVDLVEQSIRRLFQLVGQEEAQFLLRTGPSSLLRGELPQDVPG